MSNVEQTGLQLGGEKTASDVHATLCALVTTQAATHSAWAEYAAVLLGEETAAFFGARLDDDAREQGSSASARQPSKKKRKLLSDTGADGDDNGDSDDAAADDDPAVMCDHCGSAVPHVSLRVACLDGSALDLTVPERELVREVKRSVGQVRRGSHVVLKIAVTPPSPLPLLLAVSGATWTRI